MRTDIVSLLMSCGVIAPAIRNAVYQATGVAVNDAPVNPHILFKRFKEEGLFKEVTLCMI